MLSQPENEWEYDVPDRVLRAVNAFGDRDNLSILLHLRWQVAALLREVKITDLTVPEVVAMVAILAPAGGHPVRSEWDYGVVDRVADAIDNLDTRDGHRLARPAALRAQIRELMATVKMTELSACELCAMLAVLAPANGRRLVANTVEKALRPILRLVHDSPDLGDTALELTEILTEAPEKFAGA